MNKLALSFTLVMSVFSTTSFANEQHLELKKIVAQEIKATITIQLTELQKQHAVITLPAPVLITTAAKPSIPNSPKQQMQSE